MDEVKVKDLPCITTLGQAAVFYVPRHKLDDAQYGQNDLTPRKMLHFFFLANYNAYTNERSDIRGYWLNGGHFELDEHERFEVSFEGEENVPAFVMFLSKMCALMNEQAIYLTMGYKSYLVSPAEQPVKEGFFNV